MTTLAPAAAPDLSGSLLDGRYELRAVIGDGTFGRVYRAHDRRLARSVAVKLIKPWWAQDPSWVRSFEREAQLLAQLNDPGIVQIFDVGQAPEGLYYVAELVDGESLASRLRRGPLRPEDAAEIAEQLCRALGQAHARRVVHRDIKPANILLSSGGQVKLGDFGVARLAEEGTEGSASAMIAGTPKYMSPEHARGLRTTPASDTYSVGVVLYEMLAGAAPFSGESAVDVALAHAQNVPAPLPRETPRALAEIVTRALVKDPAGRYQDGDAMAAALALARQGTRTRKVDPTLLAPRFTPRRTFNPAGRRRTIALFGLVFALMIAMALIAFLPGSPGKVRVPSLRGLGKPAILAKARHLGLRPVFSSRHDSAAAGTAIAQIPSSGTRVDRGSAFRVVLSKGPPPVELPQFAGQSQGAAIAILSSLGPRARVTAVPAPGVAPGTVTGQRPAAGSYVPRHARITLLVAETPRWRPVTSFAGTDAGQSVPFRIRGRQWRVVYRMGYVGTCTFIIFCNGPNAHVVSMSNRPGMPDFGLNSGENQTRVVQTGPGVYQLRITPGSDTANWSVQVEDYY